MYLHDFYPSYTSPTAIASIAMTRQKTTKLTGEFGCLTLILNKSNLLNNVSKYKNVTLDAIFLISVGWILNSC